MELNLVIDVNNKKKGYNRYFGQKRQAKESLPPLLNEKGKLAAADMVNAVVLIEFFASAFSRRQHSCTSRIPELLRRG